MQDRSSDHPTEIPSTDNMHLVCSIVHLWEETDNVHINAHRIRVAFKVKKEKYNKLEIKIQISKFND